MLNNHFAEKSVKTQEKQTNKIKIGIILLFYPPITATFLVLGGFDGIIQAPPPNTPNN